MDDAVSYRVEDGIAFITLNRPNKLNAINRAMSSGLRDSLLQLDDDPSAQLGIVSGNGSSFCAGADVHERHLVGGEPTLDYGTGRDIVVNDHFFGFSRWKPLIAVTHGYVIGAGLGIAMRCDLVVAAESSQFQVAEIKRGLPVARFWDMLTFLCGPAFATEVVLSGRYFSAAEALSHGLVSRVTRDGSEIDEAVLVAKQILSNPPLAVRSAVRHRRYSLQELQVRSNARSAEWLASTSDFRGRADA